MIDLATVRNWKEQGSQTPGQVGWIGAVNKESSKDLGCLEVESTVLTDRLGVEGRKPSTQDFGLNPGSCPY